MLSLLWNLLAFIVAISVLVSIHEFGHFWVARRVGVHVERFSIGFGKALWRRVDKRSCEFVIALIPLGGYVKMLDERVAPVAPEQRHAAFNNKTLSQRAAVIAAGPLANFFLAGLVYWVVFMHGMPGVRPVIDQVTPDSIAAHAQIAPNMELKSVDGIETPDWDAVRMALIGKIGDQQVRVRVAPFGSQAEIGTTKTLDLRQWHYNPDTDDPVRSLGIKPKGATITTTINRVEPKTPASLAGLQAGDKIVKVNHQPTQSWMDFAQQVANSPGEPLAIEVMRSGSLLSLNLIPAKKTVQGKTLGYAGVVPDVTPLPKEFQILRQYDPLSAIGAAAGQTWQVTKLTVSVIGKLIVGDLKLSNLSGPISIAQGAGISASFGLVYYLIFLALISVNLGVVNLLPLPVLDGGHLLFLALEKLKGAPVSERFQEISYRVGAAALVLLMGVAIFNDFSRL